MIDFLSLEVHIPSYSNQLVIFNCNYLLYLVYFHFNFIKFYFQ